MKKLLIPFLLFILVQNVRSQSIIDLQAYYKLGGTRVITLLSNNTMWLHTDDKGWQQLPSDGLSGKSVKKLAVYIKTSIGSMDTRLVAVTSDNKIYWYSEGSPWEEVATTGLPNGFDVKIFTPYFKIAGLGWVGYTRYFMAQNDNTMWLFNDGKWDKLSSEGLPSGYNLKSVKSYQKYGMMGSTETRIIGVLADNSIWFTGGKKWEKVETKGLPDGADIKLFDTYMKFSLMGQPDGRLVCVLSDNTFWYMAASNKKWINLESTGLPAKYKVKFLKVFQKYAGTESGRLIITLEDNTIWWFAESTGWTKVDTAGLKLIQP